MRFILATILVESYLFGIDLLAALDIRDRYYRIGQVAVFHDQRLIHLWRFVANFFIFADVELFGRWRRPFEFDGTGN